MLSRYNLHDATVLITVTRLWSGDPYKGVDVLLEAVSRLPNESDWFVLVAGEAWGGLDSRLEEQVERLQLNERVRLAGRLIAE